MSETRNNRESAIMKVRNVLMKVNLTWEYNNERRKMYEDEDTMGEKSSY